MIQSNIAALQTPDDQAVFAQRQRVCAVGARNNEFSALQIHRIFESKAFFAREIRETHEKKKNKLRFYF